MAATAPRSATMPVASSAQQCGSACGIPPPGQRTQDFTADGIKVSQTLPTSKDIDRIADLPVLDADNQPHSFRSLYDDERYDNVLVLFVRHFFCGNCQEFLRTLSTHLHPASLPPRSTIVVIGHGSADLLAFYAASTRSPWPVYADPSKRIYAALGLARTLTLGPERPDYIGKSFVGMAWSSMLQNLGQGRKALRGGDYWQQGGEMVFSRKRGSGGTAVGAGEKDNAATATKKERARASDMWQVSWCHRMANTRDHAGIPAIAEAIGVTGDITHLDSSTDAAADAVEIVLPDASADKDGSETTGTRGSESSEDDAVRQKRAALKTQQSEQQQQQQKKQQQQAKKRWTMNEVGGGVRRSLSVRRNWSRSQSRSRAATAVAVGAH